MRIIRIVIFVTIAISFVAMNLNGALQKKTTKKALVGTLRIKKNEGSFQNAGVWIRLWEYDPFLADAAAKQFAEVKLKNIKHTQGTATDLKFSLGDSKKIHKGRKYYVTVFIYRDGKIGDNKSRILFLDGFNRVNLPGKMSGTLKRLRR